MSLRYSFRHLVYGGKIQKERLYKVLEDLDASNGGDEQDISSLKTTVGDSTKGLVKDTADLKTAVGNSDSGLVKGVADINTVIGDAETSGTILYRLAQLEAEDTTPSTPSEQEPSG